MKIALAEGLLRRKELQGKVDVLSDIRAKALFETKARRISVTDSIDDVVAEVPILNANQVTREYDWHAKQLRRIDAHIQKANWNTEIELDSEILSDYPLGS